MNNNSTEKLNEKLQNCITGELGCSLTLNIISFIFIGTFVIISAVSLITSFSVVKIILILFLGIILFLGLQYLLVLVIVLTGMYQSVTIAIYFTNDLEGLLGLIFLVIIFFVSFGITLIIFSIVFYLIVRLITYMDTIIIKRGNDKILDFIFLFRDVRIYLVGILIPSEKDNFEKYNELFFEIYTEYRKEQIISHNDEEINRVFDEEDEENLFFIKKCKICGVNNKLKLVQSSQGFYKCGKCGNTIEIEELYEDDTALKEYYDILNLKPTSNLNEIKKAYRIMLSKYHPDKVNHLGEEFSTMAHQKTLAIKNAYDEIMLTINNS